MREYYIGPTLQQGQKSFYGKAFVREDDDGSKTLYSYNTPIIRVNPDNSYTRLWDSWSLTIGKHIKAFCGMNKREFESVPME